MADNKNLDMFEGIEIPERLKPDNIAKMLEDNKETKTNSITPADNSKKITPSVKPKSKKMKIFATVAAGAVLIVGIATALKLNQNDFPSVGGTGFDFTTELKMQQDYSDVYNTIKQVNAMSNKHTFSFSDLINGFIGGNTKDEETATPESTDTNSTSSQNTDYSTTHQQVEGVEEADIIKTDGNTIYYVANGCLYIVNSDNGKLSLQSKIQNADLNVKQIYITGNKVILISNKINKNKITYTEDYDDVPSGTRDTVVQVVDVTDKSKPNILSSYSQNGDYVSSRLIDNNLYISTNYRNYNAEPIKDEKEIEKYIPSYSLNDKSEYIKANDICIPEKCPDTNYTIVAGLDIDNPDMLVSIKALLGFNGTVYGSKDNYYVAGVRYDKNVSKTAIARFSIKKGEIEHTGYCEVNGAVSNQFAMDEYNGNFRIATTGVNDKVRSSSVFVLDKNMKVIGKLENLAKKETIQSARFENETLYLVTFERKDPLFKIDLSNPAKPKVLSELKINGYSSYLIDYGEGKLLGFGIDADDDGRQTGLKLSMFNKDANGDVKEITSKPLGTDLAGAHSAGTYDHKALLIDEKKNVIGIPVRFYDGIDSCNRYYLFKYTDTEGFVEIGNIETHDINGMYAFIRGMYIGDKVYMFTEGSIICAGINDMKQISAVNLVDPAKQPTHYEEVD